MGEISQWGYFIWIFRRLFVKCFNSRCIIQRFRYMKKNKYQDSKNNIVMNIQDVSGFSFNQRYLQDCILSCILKFINLRRANISTADNFFIPSNSPTWCWCALSDDFTSYYKSFFDSIKSHRSLLQLLDTLTRNLYFSSVGLNENLIENRLFRLEPFPRAHRRQLHLLKFNNDFSCLSSIAPQNARIRLESKDLCKNQSDICAKKIRRMQRFFFLDRLNVLENHRFFFLAWFIWRMC